MNSTVRNAILWVIIIALVGMIYGVFHNQKPQSDQPAFSELVQKVKAGEVVDVVINSATGDIQGHYKNKDEFHSTIPSTYNEFVTLLIDNHVQLKYDKDNSNGWMSILLQTFPIVLVAGFWVFMMRQMQSGGNKALSFGKSRARLHSSQQKKVTFKDVAGVEEAKEELQEIIEFLREPQKFQKLG